MTLKCRPSQRVPRGIYRAATTGWGRRVKVLTRFTKTEIPRLRHDHMVNDANSEQYAGRAESFRHRPVLGARTGISARVVVNQNERRSRASDRVSKDLSRMDEARGQRPDRNLDGRDESMTAVEEQNMKGLAL